MEIICELVYEDRVNNEKNATIARVGAVPAGAGSDDDDSDDGETMDPKYFSRTK